MAIADDFEIQYAGTIKWESADVNISDERSEHNERWHRWVWGEGPHPGPPPAAKPDENGYTLADLWFYLEEHGGLDG